MSLEFSNLIAGFKNKQELICISCSDKKRKRRVSTANEFGQPFENKKDLYFSSLNPQHKELLKCANGFTLYHAKSNTEIGEWEAGFRFFSVEESKRESSVLFDQFQTKRFQAIARVIGAADTYVLENSGCKSIILLNHEVNIEHIEDLKITAPDIRSLLEILLYKPERELAANWRLMGKGVMDQWYPVGLPK